MNEIFHISIASICVFAALIPGNGPHIEFDNALLWALAAGNALFALTAKKD